MRVLRRAFLWWFWCGVAAFALAVYVHLPLMTEGVPGGIADHQAAPDAATINAIQQSWRSDGLWTQAAVAMVVDLVFIGIYGVGCLLGGIYFRASDRTVLLALGWVAYLSAIAFVISDYGETISQIIQLWSFKGDDGLAMAASTLRPIKMVAFTSAFLAIIAALAIERFSTGDA
ncbi:hypothetical protein [Erythrobacter sp. JK5]|uniref:hypothetical protein n=1 Tax=Erythrobacter sp. JK5 TaxID=2829500 RepID=UPI001BA49F01|nr:hypothetical protein [Erythrobacter sp. JK5]QUL38504.1 hypothetical protein KDC96_03635 [Erythrobacter sp. JK5]